MGEAFAEFAAELFGGAAARLHTLLLLAALRGDRGMACLAAHAESAGDTGRRQRLDGRLYALDLAFVLLSWGIVFFGMFSVAYLLRNGKTRQNPVTWSEPVCLIGFTALSVLLILLVVLPRRAVRRLLQGPPPPDPPAGESFRIEAQRDPRHTESLGDITEASMILSALVFAVLSILRAAPAVLAGVVLYRALMGAVLAGCTVRSRRDLVTLAVLDREGIHIGDGDAGGRTVPWRDVLDVSAENDTLVLTPANPEEPPVSLSLKGRVFSAGLIMRMAGQYRGQAADAGRADRAQEETDVFSKEKAANGQG